MDKKSSIQISVINSIVVPFGMEETAIEIRNQYVDYFRRQPGFVQSTFYKSINSESKFNFINIVVWESREAFEKVVNSGFTNHNGLNEDGMKVLGKGFPSPIQVFPGQYEVVES